MTLPISTPAGACRAASTLHPTRCSYLRAVIGLRLMRRTAVEGVFRERREALPYCLFFLGTVLVGFGSGHYHLAPDNDRLLWDRLAMMLAFMAGVRRHRRRARRHAGRSAPAAAGGRVLQRRLVGLERGARDGRPALLPADATSRRAADSFAAAPLSTALRRRARDLCCHRTLSAGLAVRSGRPGGVRIHRQPGQWTHAQARDRRHHGGGGRTASAAAACTVRITA